MGRHRTHPCTRLAPPVLVHCSNHARTPARTPGTHTAHESAHPLWVVKVASIIQESRSRCAGYAAAIMPGSEARARLVRCSARLPATLCANNTRVRGRPSARRPDGLPRCCISPSEGASLPVARLAAALCHAAGSATLAPSSRAHAATLSRRRAVHFSALQGDATSRPNAPHLPATAT